MFTGILTPLTITPWTPLKSIHTTSRRGRSTSWANTIRRPLLAHPTWISQQHLKLTKRPKVKMARCPITRQWMVTWTKMGQMASTVLWWTVFRQPRFNAISIQCYQLPYVYNVYILKIDTYIFTLYTHWCIYKMFISINMLAFEINMILRHVRCDRERSVRGGNVRGQISSTKLSQWYYFQSINYCMDTVMYTIPRITLNESKCPYNVVTMLITLFFKVFFLISIPITIVNLFHCFSDITLLYKIHV